MNNELFEPQSGKGSRQMTAAEIAEKSESSFQEAAQEARHQVIGDQRVAANGDCVGVSHALCDILKAQGVDAKYTFGYYRGISHFWVVVGDTYIDPTHDQFAGPEIRIGKVKDEDYIRDYEPRNGLGWRKDSAAKTSAKAPDIAGSSAGLTPSESHSSTPETPAKLPVTETPAFKAWFADSKVVDAEGKPLRVYHGTRYDFEAFRMNPQIAYGIYFTDSPEYSGKYTGEEQEGARTIPVYLRITNPIPWQTFVEGHRKDRKNNLKNLIDQGYDGVITDQSHEWGLDIPDAPGVYIVFDPHQIKSAIGNNGQFNSESKSITAEQATPNEYLTEIPSWEEFVQHSADGHVERLVGELTKNTYADSRDPKLALALEKKYQKAIQWFNSISFPCEVYRAVRLKSLDSMRWDDAGTSWSIDERKAQVIYGLMSSGKDYVIKGTVDRDAVDISITLYWAMAPTHKAEKELRLKDGAKISNVSLRKGTGEWSPVPRKGTGEWSPVPRMVTASPAQPLFDWSKPSKRPQYITLRSLENASFNEADMLRERAGMEIDYDAELDENKKVSVRWVDPLSYDIEDTPLDDREESYVTELAKAMKAGKKFSPAVVHNDMFVDGNHRVEAALLLKYPLIPVVELEDFLVEGYEGEDADENKLDDFYKKWDDERPCVSCKGTGYRDEDVKKSMEDDSIIPRCPTCEGTGYTRRSTSVTANVGEELYHGTLIESVPSIQKYGLRPTQVALKKKKGGQWSTVTHAVTAAITPNDRTLYHGTNTKGTIDKLKPTGGEIFLWLGEHDTAKDLYANSYTATTPGANPRVYEVQLKPSARIANLLDPADSFRQKFIERLTEKDGAVPSEEWLTAFGSIHRNEIWVRDTLKSMGYAGVIVNDSARDTVAKKTRQHHSVALWDMNAIETQQEMPKTAASVPGDQLTDTMPLAPTPVSPQFKSWFGNSKVVNEDGTPRIVFHGSRSPWLTAFDLRCEGTGCVNSEKRGAIWFTSEFNNASWYADYRDKFEAEVNDPITYGKEGEWFAVVSSIAESEESEPEHLFSVGPYATEEEAEEEAMKEAKLYNANLHLDTFVTSAYLRIENPLVVNVVPRGAEFDAARAGGHDGIIAHDVSDPEYSDIFVVFNPNQIKSAVRNSGQYDPNTSRITAEKKDKDILDEFMRDLWSQTTGNPFNPRERVWNDVAGIEARPFDGRIHLSFIRSFEKKTGAGRDALKFFCDLADKHNVEVDLAPVPVGKDGLRLKDLKAWYMRNGFVPRRGDNLVRYPNGENPEPTKLVTASLCLFETLAKEQGVTPPRADRDDPTHQPFFTLVKETTLYHATNTKHLPSILKRGLRPSGGKLFLGTKETCRRFTASDVDVVILAVTLSAGTVLYDNNFECDEVYIKDGISPTSIQLLSENTQKTASGFRQLWHGGRITGQIDIQAPTKGRYEAGPGLYLTTNYNRAVKYAKGGGSTFLITIKDNIRFAEDVLIPLKDGVEFATRYLGGKGKEIAADLKRNCSRYDREAFTANVIINLVVNYEAGAGAKGKALLTFLQDHGVDAALETPSMAYPGEQWVVVFNPSVVTKVQKVPASEVTPEMRELPKVAVRIPKQVFHGTPVRFEEYHSDYGTYYFTGNTSYAEWFAHRRRKDNKWTEEGALQVYELKLINPFDARKFPKITAKEYSELVGIDISVLIDDVGENQIIPTKKLPFWKWFRNSEEASKAALEASGYDGVVQKEGTGLNHAELKATSYVAFSPSQFKKVAKTATKLKSEDYPPRLNNAEEIADYINDLSGGYIDTEFIAEMFHHSHATLQLIPVAMLKAGHPDANVPNEANEKRYMKMDVSTLPPLVVEGGVVEDGNHRLRVAIAKGLTHVWCYVVTPDEDVKLSAKFNIDEVEIVPESYDSGTFLAMYKGKRIGYVTVFRNGGIGDGYGEKETTVYKSYVSSPYRRKGVGTKMYNAAKEWCASRGWKLVPTSSAALSDEAHAFWNKFEPEAVALRSLWWKKQYVGREVEVDGRTLIIESVLGHYPNFNFMGRDPASNTTMWLKGDKVIPQLGEPDPNPDRNIEVPKTLSKNGSVNIDFTEKEITPEQSSFELTKLPGVIIHARIDGIVAGGIEVHFDGDKALVRGIQLKDEFKGQGIGQKIYDHAIAYCKQRGCTNFYSDLSSNLYKDGWKAWDRLRKRYPVTFEQDDSGNDIGRNRINLKTADARNWDISLSRLKLNPHGLAIAQQVVKPNGNNNDNPVVVMPLPDGMFYVLDGYHRVVQALVDGKNEVSTIARPYNPERLKNEGDPSTWETLRVKAAKVADVRNWDFYERPNANGYGEYDDRKEYEEEQIDRDMERRDRGHRSDLDLVNDYVSNSDSLSEKELIRLGNIVKSSTISGVPRILRVDDKLVRATAVGRVIDFRMPLSFTKAVIPVLKGRGPMAAAFTSGHKTLIMINNPTRGLDVDYSKLNLQHSAHTEQEVLIAGKYKVVKIVKALHPGTTPRLGYDYDKKVYNYGKGEGNRLVPMVILEEVGGGKTASDDSAMAFLNEANTLPGIELKWKGDNTFLLKGIQSENKGAGQGREVLSRLCSLADKYDITITLKAVPYNLKQPGLNQQQLREWYMRHGFEPTEGVTMERKPKQGIIVHEG